MALQRAEIRMVSWMCGVKLKDRVSSKELRERLGIVGIMSVLQQNRLRWHGHVLRKEDNDWVKKCMEYEVVGSRSRGRPKRTWLEVVQRDCQVRGLSRDDAMVRGRWRRLIRMVDEQEGCEWMFLLVPAHLGRPGQRAIKWLHVCVSNVRTMDNPSLH